LTATSLPSADSDFSKGAGSVAPSLIPPQLSRFDGALLGGLALLSAALLLWATGDRLLAAGFFAGLAIATSS
jgi:two-component system cell cycle sensor histidine kinase/response regulator CckA